MLLMLLAKIFMFILNNICHTLLSILVLRIWVLNQTTFPTGTFPYPPPPPLPHLSAWNVLLLLEEVSFWSALRLKGLNKTNSFSWITEVTRGKEKMHWIPNYCSFFHLSSCAIQSLRLFGLSPFTPSLPWVTKTEFLLTISIHHQAGKWWEYRKKNHLGNYKLIQYQIL